MQLFGIIVVALTLPVSAFAQQAATPKNGPAATPKNGPAATPKNGPAATPKNGPATTAGPGRIICKNAASCELGLGPPAKLKYRINATALPDADKERLAKQCTTQHKTPCVVTVQGTELGDAMKVKAMKITFHN